MYLFFLVAHLKPPLLYFYWTTFFFTFLASLKISPQNGSSGRPQTSSGPMFFQDLKNPFYSGIYVQVMLSRAVACVCSNDDANPNDSIEGGGCSY